MPISGAVDASSDKMLLHFSRILQMTLQRIPAAEYTCVRSTDRSAAADMTSSGSTYEPSLRPAIDVTMMQLGTGRRNQGGKGLNRGHRVNHTPG